MVFFVYSLVHNTFIGFLIEWLVLYMTVSVVTRSLQTFQWTFYSRELIVWSKKYELKGCLLVAKQNIEYVQISQIFW